MKNLDACIQTYSGIMIDLKNPCPEDILVPDIAHQLSNICRFTGAVRKGYSVAQHCCLVSKFINDNNPLKLQGLLHDAAEAYLGDVSTPLKKMLPEYRVLENRMQTAIIKRFDLNIKNFDEVKIYDKMALVVESKALMGPRHPVWEKYQFDTPPDYDLDYGLMVVNPMTPEEAEKEYLDIFYKLWLDVV